MKENHTVSIAHIVDCFELSNQSIDQVSLTISAAFSPIRNVAAFVCAAGMSGTEIKDLSCRFYLIAQCLTY